MRISSPRVLIVDDAKSIRAKIKEIILSVDFTCIGEADNGTTAISMYKRLKPDILLLDIEMPSPNGKDVLKELKKEFEDACIIMLTSVANPEIVKECINLGANGYILKSNNKPKIQGILRWAWKKQLEKKDDNLV